ncbi:MAG: hypothetical protein CMP71_01625 [Flavobacteriales bacterium]|nr:hypothetical protein [Flavobacteriales bacterium]|tara:strand:+ start:3701 stop:4564 length:864 start_codon:yes stop_codon:yes gene_type:complete
MIKNFFHIGYHKTGTTWFQKSFYPLVENIKFIERQNIRDHFYENKEKVFTNNFNVFCDEELSGNLHNDGLSGFLTASVRYKISKFQNPVVIIFIRNQFDIIESSYLQYVKEGGNFSIKKYLFHEKYPDRKNRFPLFSFNHFNYYNLIKSYCDLIGKENVFIYTYEDFSSNTKAFVQKFIKEHGLKIDIKNIDFSKKNKSYSIISYYLAKLISRFTFKNVLFKHYFFHIPWLYEKSTKLLSKIEILPAKNYNIVNKDLKKYIHKTYKESNQKLHKNFGIDLSNKGYPI